MFYKLKCIASALAFIPFMISCSKNNDSPSNIVGTNTNPATTTTDTTTVALQTAHTININQLIGGFYEALPANYQAGTKKYPLLISLHGGGQVGDGNNDLSLLLNDGVAKEIGQRRFPVNFTVDGNTFSFIVLTPQFRDYPADSLVFSFIDYALRNYRVDSSRIYLTGLSMGGILTTEMAGQHAALFAAVATMAGESFAADKLINAAGIAKGNLAFWDFHNIDDPSIPVSVSYDFNSFIRSNNPGILPKLTIFKASGHDAWTEALDPSYRENGMNVYEWMLHYKR